MCFLYIVLDIKNLQDVYNNIRDNTLAQVFQVFQIHVGVYYFALKMWYSQSWREFLPGTTTRGHGGNSSSGPRVWLAGKYHDAIQAITFTYHLFVNNVVSHRQLLCTVLCLQVYESKNTPTAMCWFKNSLTVITELP